MESIAFRTQARTIDHLGREQIADCPTAISELWKNAYDAYAESVELNIYDGAEPVATIVDDGHGMSYEEFVERWLVVGTESKFSDEQTPNKDRNGLWPRTKQGQKGIGRLSSANLGPLFLIVSKRKSQKFVAALIDWRIFENPFLTLSDIKIPVVQFEDKEQIFEHLPGLFEGLTANIWGSAGDAASKHRIEAAWAAYDKYVIDSQEEGSNESPPSEKIAQTIINTRFTERHFSDWQLWGGGKAQGTIMLVSGINYDLRALIDDISDDVTIKDAKSRIFETLSSFVDPYLNPINPGANDVDPQFIYSVRAHYANRSRYIVGTELEFSRKETDIAEHIVEGTIDGQGVFHGQVKAFGEWLKIGSDYLIQPPKDLKIHKRKDWLVGPIDIYIAGYERDRKNSVLSAAEFNRLDGLSERYAGFLVFRNSLRLLPFGREDNDFFEIETRRTSHAGREYWNARKMFGRVALSRENNPNLRDKAGREGFIDSVAAKTLKKLVENILKQTARDYFGHASEIRQELLPTIQSSNKHAKANEERNKLRKKQRSQFRTKLKAISKDLPSFLNELVLTEQSLEIKSVEDISIAQEKLDQQRTALTGFRLPGAPQNLGSIEDEYSEYRAKISETNEIISRFSEKIESAIQSIKPANPQELIEKQLQRNAAQLHSRIRKWQSNIKQLQEHEQDRIKNLIDERNKLFHAKALPLVGRVERGDMPLSEASELMEVWRSTLDMENEDIFESYIRALDSLTESIDLEFLAIDSTEENDDLRVELDRLNGLAQLGISVEILGHELQSYDEMIGRGIGKLSKLEQNIDAVADIRIGYEGLTNQLRFLSPLKLSGEKVQKWITGQDIFNYVTSFYSTLLERKDIKFSATKLFLDFRVFDQPARLFPVFINLVNNSMFWVGNMDQVNKEIRLGIFNDEVVVSDNGPGVDEMDVRKLFSLFFTKKLRGGRGVGLYLAKANLAAAGHRIHYEEKVSAGLLSGANFVIKFKGAEYAR